MGWVAKIMAPDKEKCYDLFSERELLWAALFYASRQEKRDTFVVSLMFLLSRIVMDTENFLEFI